jgi:mutator protein MutT
MKLRAYLKTVSKPLRQATLCFLIKEDKILLAMKKRGFGVNKYNGVGGKKDDNETIENTAKRETHEEIGVIVKELEQVATLDFYFPYNLNWGQQVIVFLVKEWQGEPQESEEMAPEWFDKSDMPFHKMWPDDECWLPLILDGKKVKGEFLFGENEEIIDYKIKIL